MAYKEESRDKLELPYGADYAIVNQMLEAIGRRGESISTSELFKLVISARNAPQKSYNLGMAKFLGLVEAQGSTLKLTQLGKQYYVRQKTERKKYLAFNIPSGYKTVLNWIDFGGGSLSISEIKTNLVKGLSSTPNKGILHSMVNNFARYTSELGLIRYVKGGQGRCDILDLGKEVLGSAPVGSSGNDSGASINSTKGIAKIGAEDVPVILPSDKPNIIKIISQVGGNTLPVQTIEVESEEDLEQVDVFKRMYLRRFSKK